MVASLQGDHLSAHQSRRQSPPYGNHSWKDRGWNKKKLNSPNRAGGEIKNLELWQAIDAALGDALITGSLAIKWVKGHAGIAGNERADELAEMGRQEAISGQSEQRVPTEDLDERYRQIMGAA